MIRLLRRSALVSAAVGLICLSISPWRSVEAGSAPEEAFEDKYTHSPDVIYAHKGGVALTMDAFVPRANANGAGVIVFVSAKYFSSVELLAVFHPTVTMPFLNRGYAVFQVLHRSQPSFTVPDIVEDAHRAVRFVKCHAKEYGVDPAKIGVAGASSGGHLSLMMGCAGRPGDPKSEDPVERLSSHAAAVACYFPPSDFLALVGEKLADVTDVAAAFDFREMDKKTGLLERVSEKRREEIARAISPIAYASKTAAPTLIVHGDKDDIVPISQSEAMIKKLKDCGVESKLIVKEGKKHFEFGWVVAELPTLADWFDVYLLGKKLPQKAFEK